MLTINEQALEVLATMNWDLYHAKCIDAGHNPKVQSNSYLSHHMQGCSLLLVVIIVHNIPLGFTAIQ